MQADTDLTDDEINLICERFDLTDPKLQRRTIVKLIMENDALKQQLAAGPRWQELRDWQQYASYCRCCAESGEHRVKDFASFVGVLRSGPIPTPPEAP